MFDEHEPQTTRPQTRQWWRRKKRSKCDLQTCIEQAVACASACQNLLASWRIGPFLSGISAWSNVLEFSPSRFASRAAAEISSCEPVEGVDEVYEESSWFPALSDDVP